MIDLNMVNQKLAEVIYPVIGKWRNLFHLEAPFGLINDPNGLLFYDGVYSIFFQWNPKGINHANKSWLKVTTKDFVTFTRPVLALAPDTTFDGDGCFSGSGQCIDGKELLFYTSIMMPEGKLAPTQAIAAFNPNTNKYEKKVVVSDIPVGYNTEHIRDPYYFTKNNKHWFIVGAQTENKEGRLLTYQSDNLDDWNLVGEVNIDYTDNAYMWECPNLVELDGHDLLVICPQGLNPGEQDVLRNFNEVGYIIGDFDVNTNTFSSSTPYTLVDTGFEFYAPQIFKDDKRTLMIGWLGLPDKDMHFPTTEHKFSLSIPREIWIEDLKLHQKPIDEMKNLRQAELKFSNQTLNLEQRAAEINIEIPKDVDVTILFEFDSEFCSLEINQNYQMIRIVRQCKYPEKKERHIQLTKPITSLQLFLDETVIEGFVNDGEAAWVMPIFPEAQGTHVVVESTKAVALTGWKLGQIQYK